MESKAWEISVAEGLFLVPLKNICSRKWEMPLVDFFSYLEPAPHKTMAVTDLTAGRGDRIIRRPFSKVIFSNESLITSNSNIEFRNSKQIQITKTQNSKHFNIGKLEFRNCFGIRASDFGFI